MTSEPRPWSDLRGTGLLWLINATVFHPRGYALAIHLDDDGTATGWSLIGDGREPWRFDVEGLPDRQAVDDAFRAAKTLMP